MKFQQASAVLAATASVARALPTKGTSEAQMPLSRRTLHRFNETDLERIRLRITSSRDPSFIGYVKGISSDVSDQDVHSLYVLSKSQVQLSDPQLHFWQQENDSRDDDSDDESTDDGQSDNDGTEDPETEPEPDDDDDDDNDNDDDDDHDDGRHISWTPDFLGQRVMKGREPSNMYRPLALRFPPDSKIAEVVFSETKPLDKGSAIEILPSIDKQGKLALDGMTALPEVVTAPPYPWHVCCERKAHQVTKCKLAVPLTFPLGTDHLCNPVNVTVERVDPSNSTHAFFH